MHDEAMTWVRAHEPTIPGAVLDIGGRNINGTARDAFDERCDYTVLDIADGPGVDIVADAATWVPDREYDVVVCCEVFEHTASWPEICATVHKALRPGGLLIATMAGPGRPPHSAVDGQFRLHPGEYYGNVEPGDLKDTLNALGFVDVVVDQQARPADVRAVAWR